MFDDILGPRREDLKPYLGEKNVKPASVGGVDSPEGMDPNKKPAGISGLKGRPVNATRPAPQTPAQAVDEDDEPELELDLDFDDDDDCDCDDCNCDGGDCGIDDLGDIGCLDDKEPDQDIWSTLLRWYGLR
jgi:hypothetical protein